MVGVDGVAGPDPGASAVQTFDSDGVRLAFIDEGEGDPVLLIHGFASSVRTNWIEPGWVSLLTKSGYRVIAIDNRGHGESEKLHDRALYSAPLMAEDARRLLDHVGVSRADVMGYSMGARITAFLALAHPPAFAAPYSAASAATWCGRWPAPDRSPTPWRRPPSTR
jgi:pimeloyl-ACP methyl ester carboxylesterase